jgi:hypothetical protein
MLLVSFSLVSRQATTGSCLVLLLLMALLNPLGVSASQLKSVSTLLFSSVPVSVVSHWTPICRQ